MIAPISLHNKDCRWRTALLVYYDLEYSGNICSEFGKDCSIWEMAFICKREQLFCMVNPYLSKDSVQPPVDDKYMMPTREEYEKNVEAVPFEEAYNRLVAFVSRLLNKYKKKWVCLISHNGNRSDKIVFENELVYHQLPTLPFFFFDSLLYIREVFPGLESYSLENLYMKLFDKKHEGHNAKTDTRALVKIFRKLCKPLHGVLYPMHTIPWRNIRGIGYHTEQSLLNLGVNDIVHLFALSKGDADTTKALLNTYISERVLQNIFYWYKLAECIYDRPCISIAIPQFPTVKAFC